LNPKTTHLCTPHISSSGSSGSEDLDVANVVVVVVVVVVVSKVEAVLAESSHVILELCLIQLCHSHQSSRRFLLSIWL